MNEYLQSSTDDMIIFLDSDAWIQNKYWLKNILDYLNRMNEYNGAFSRDPYSIKNTYINSGSFILKVNDFTKEMYKNLIIELDDETEQNNIWPYDQYFISDYVYKNKDKFLIFVPTVLNTPDGRVLRHNWFKND